MKFLTELIVQVVVSEYQFYDDYTKTSLFHKLSPEFADA